MYIFLVHWYLSNTFAVLVRQYTLQHGWLSELQENLFMVNICIVKLVEFILINKKSSENIQNYKFAWNTYILNLNIYIHRWNKIFRILITWLPVPYSNFWTKQFQIYVLDTIIYSPENCLNLKLVIPRRKSGGFPHIDWC